MTFNLQASFTIRAMTKSLSNKASVKEISLKEGASSLRRGSTTHYWHIFYNEVRVGRVYINWRSKLKQVGAAFITVELNQGKRGKGIGTIVFAMASELSFYDTVYAEMRKGNIASKTAATKAGFLPDKDYTGAQMQLVWKRNNVQR